MSSHRILLTGANGFIASHILTQLLSSPANHSVRAVVRSQSKVNDVKSHFPNASPQQLDFAIVSVMTVSGAFDEALKSDPPFDIILHTASPFLYKATSSAADFLNPAIKGTTEILHAIQRITPSAVQRVILTSSYAAVGAFGRADESNKVYTEADWNPVTLEDVENKSENSDVAYLASKKFAEQEAWSIQKGVDVKWELIALNPPMVYGPLAHTVTDLESLNESNGLIWNAFLKEKKPNGDMPPTPFGLPIYVDVRDVAAAHVLAMDAPNAGNQRFLISAGAADSQKIADILRAEVKGAEERVPKGEPGKNTLPDDAFSADNRKSLAVLGLRYRSAKETFADLGRQLLGMEKGV